MADIAALVVALSAQVSKFEKDMKDAVGIADKATRDIEKRFSTLNKTIVGELQSFTSGYANQLGALGSVLQSIGPVGLTIAAGLGAAAVAMGFLTEKTNAFVAKAKEMREFSETTGLTLDQVKGLGIVATKVGADFETAQKGVMRMAIAIEELRTKGTGPLYDTLNRINPALVKQVITADSAADAIDILAKAMGEMSREQQQLAFGAELFGKRQLDNVRILKEIFAQGGLVNIGQQLADSGKGIDKEFTERMVKLKNEIDAINKRTENLFGKAFAPEIMALQKQSAEFWERIASAINIVADRARSGQPIVNDQTTMEFLSGGVPLGTAGAAKGTISASGKATGGNLPEPQRFEQGPTNFKPARDPIKEAEDRKALLAVDITFMERWIGLLGDAATEEEKLKLKRLQGNKAVEDNIKLQPAFQRGMDAATLAAREQNLALKERLGVATQVEITEVKQARAEEQIARLALTGADAERVRAKAVNDSRIAFENMQVAASRVPDLTRFAIDGQNALKQFSDFTISAFGSFENAIADVATGTSSLQDAFKKMADSIIRDLIRITVRMTITAPIAQALQSMFNAPGGGGGFAALFQRAGGGPVKAGEPYIVGEKGPELFVPSGSGSIVPSHLTKGASATGSTVEINNYVGADTETRQSTRNDGPGGEKIVIDIVRKAQARGDLDSSSRSRYAIRPPKVR